MEDIFSVIFYLYVVKSKKIEQAENTVYRKVKGR